MNIEELYDEVEKDLKIDDTELDLESIRTPQLHNKYLKLYTKHSLQLKRLQDEYKVLSKHLTYWKQKYDEFIHFSSLKP